MFSPVALERVVQLALYTDSYMIHGTVHTRQHRVTDILDRAADPFLVLEDAVIEEYGTRGDTTRSEFAQVNLATVLFAVSDVPVEPVPELRTPKVPEQALITVPPFKLVGTIHLMPERDLRLALEELTGRFIPMTEVTYWSDAIGEPRTTAAMVAFNHDRAQILAPHRVVDPWAGLDRSAPGAAGEPGQAPGPGGAGDGAPGEQPTGW
jgi:hypothetical protein